MNLKKCLRWMVCALLVIAMAVVPALALEETTEEEESIVQKNYQQDELVCTYTFTTYGYGHGCGMSQVGAVTYADTNGRFRWNYVQILLHYYPSSHMAYEENVPATIVYNGGAVNTRDLIAHSVFAEIGGYCTQNNIEAVKAQAVAIYTFLKHNNYRAGSGGIAWTSRAPGQLIYNCVDAVMGQYVAYDSNGAPGMGLFSASFPSWTASSGSTWGGKDTEGLGGGVYSPEKVSIRKVTMDAEDVIAIANTYNAGKPNEKKIHLSGDPSTWMEIVEHDGCYSDHIGYVTKIRIGDQTMSGNTLKTLLFRVPGVPGLRSHCFSLTYDLVPGAKVPGNGIGDYTEKTES